VGPNQGGRPTEEISRDLLHWLDEGTNSDGQRYAEVRQRLELYFDRKNCVASGELADETLKRVAKRLGESGEVIDVAPLRYCYTVAKYVFLETLSGEKRAPFHRPLTSPTASNISGQSASLPEADSGLENGQKSAACLNDCMTNLSSADRDLLVEYYRGKQQGKIERRAALAARLGLTPHTLSIRAGAVRRGLETCLQARLNKQKA
jgi:hypothetical protein